MCDACKGRGWVCVESPLTGIDAAYDCPSSNYKPSYEWLPCPECNKPPDVEPSGSKAAAFASYVDKRMGTIMWAKPFKGGS